MAKPEFQLHIGSTKVSSPSKGSAKLQLGFSHNDSPATSTSFLGLSGSGQNTEGSSLKQGNIFYSSSNLPSGNDFRQQEDQPRVSANRWNLDLNILTNSCDNNSSSSIERQSDVEMGGLQKKLESYPSSELAGTSTGSRDTRPGKHMLQKCVYDFGLENLSPASSGHKIYEVSLDLQLKPPCKPEPKFNWSDFSPANEDSDEERISLGLSLLGSCIVPELHDTRLLKNGDVELDQRNLFSALHVNLQADVSLQTAGASNLVSDCSGSTKSVSPYGQAHGHPKGTGEVSPPKVAISARKTASIMVVPQRSCGTKAKKFHDNVETTCASNAKDFYSNFEIDLNIPLSDSDDSCQATANSSKPTLAESAWECVTQDHDEVHHDSSSLLHEMDVVVANSSRSIPEPTELEPEELNTATNVSEADVSGSVVSHGNKPGILDVLSGDHSKMVNLNCNGSASSKVSSDEVRVELDGTRSVADSGEEIEEFEEEPDEVSREEIEEYEEIIEEVSGEESDGEFEEVVEVSCDDQSDGSHHVEGDDDTYVKEFEEVVEEVACDDASDRSHHGEDAEHIEPESINAIGGVNSVAANVPITIPSQGDEREKHVENATVCMEKRKVEATMLESLQPSALDASTTTMTMPMKRERDWGTKSCLDKDISQATEEGITKPSQGTWVTKSGLSKDIDGETELGNSKKGWGSWGTIAEAAEGGSTKHDWGTWETKSCLDKDIAQATEEGSTNQSQGTWGTKSGLSKDIDGATELGNTKKGWGSWGPIAGATEGGSTKHDWGNWETKSGPKDTGEVTRRGRYEVSRHQDTQRFRDATHGNARKHDVPLVKGGRIITLKNERSSFDEGKRYHAPANPSHIERDMFPAKSFRHDNPHPRWHRDDMHNRQFHRPDNNRNEPNHFGMRRSDYSWVRNENDSSHCDQKFPKARTSDIGADIALSSQRQAREGETQPRNVSRSPGGGYVRRDTWDFEAPVENERRVVRRDFTGRIVDHHKQYAQVESPHKRRRGSPVDHDSGTDPRGFSSSVRPFKHHSRPSLRSPQTSVRSGTQFYHERAHFPPVHVAPRHEATTDDAREIPPQYNVPVTSLRRNVGLRMFDVHHQPMHEESFSHSQYYHVRDQTAADAGPFDERHTGVHHGPPRTPAYPNIRRLGDARTVDAESLDEMNFGVENDSRLVQYGQEQPEDFQERRGNVRDRLGCSPSEGRGARGQAARKACHDPKFSDAGLNRRI